MSEQKKETNPEEIQKLEAVLQLPETAELIDETFYVWETRYGMWSTMTQKGRKMLTGLTREAVVDMTRWHLKCEQDGTLHLYTRVVGSRTVAVDL